MFSSVKEEKITAERIYFIHYLRAIAVLMVLWGHWVGQYLHATGQSWILNDWITRFIIEPLGIIQYFGFFGVVLFFLISGFIITHTGLKEGKSEFVIKRLLRIYPMLIFSIFVCLLWKENINLPNSDPWHILRSMFLLNYFIPGQTPINGVAWSLVVELQFYFSFIMLSKWIAESPCKGILLQSLLVLWTLVTCRYLGPYYFLFCVSYSYLPFLLVGQIFYFYSWKRCLSISQCTSLLLIQYGLILFGTNKIHPDFMTINNSYLLSFFYATALFLVFLHWREHLAENKLVSLIANSSYSIYLLHGNIGMVALILLDNFGATYVQALGLAVIFTAIVCYLTWRYIEQPSQRLARQLVTRWNLTTPKLVEA